jgi:hypothetical protein
LRGAIGLASAWRTTASTRNALAQPVEHSTANQAAPDHEEKRLNGVSGAIAGRYHESLDGDVLV